MKLKLSQHYLQYSSPLRDYLSLEVCEYVVNNFIKKEVQVDNRIRYWAFIKKYNKYLRVIIDVDNETIVTAHFDRNFKIGNKNEI